MWFSDDCVPRLPLRTSSRYTEFRLLIVLFFLLSTERKKIVASNLLQLQAHLLHSLFFFASAPVIIAVVAFSSPTFNKIKNYYWIATSAVVRRFTLSCCLFINLTFSWQVVTEISLNFSSLVRIYYAACVWTVTTCVKHRIGSLMSTSAYYV